MKTPVFSLSLLAVMMSACTTVNPPHASWQVQPVNTVHHGGPGAQSYYQLGRYFQGQRRLDKAEEAFQSALALDDNHFDALNALASVYAERGNLERAVSTFERLAAKLPGAAYVQNNLGYAYLLQGRNDAAYAALHQALVIDGQFERAWVNLDRLAAADGPVEMEAALKTRQVAMLPATVEFAPASLAAPVAPVVAASDGSALSTPLPALVPPPGALIAMAAIAPASTPVAAAAPPASAPRAEAARFMLVSATSEVLATAGGQVEFDVPHAVNIAAGASSYPPKARIEITNGNGVSRFANTFKARLQQQSIPVMRITNWDSYTLKTSVVEFQPGYADVARRLQELAAPMARLAPAKERRAGTDVRVVLGRDALTLRPV